MLIKYHSHQEKKANDISLPRQKLYKSSVPYFPPFQTSDILGQYDQEFGKFLWERKQIKKGNLPE